MSLKNVLVFLLLFFLLIPLSEGKKLVFVSKYSSRSMDAITLDYYEHILNSGIFSDVEIFKDTEIVNNPETWKTTFEDADLIFVISLDVDMFNITRDVFCDNLAMVLTEKKGIIFAGNSLLAEETIYGCPYTSYFNLAIPSNNTKLRSSSVRVIKNHEITDGYEINESYNLGMEDRVLTIVNPVDGVSLGTVYGDPDGPGFIQEGSYSFLTVWEGIGYRAAIWGINTSSLTGCEKCLNWKLFDQLLKWTSNTEEIGFKVTTNKEIYYPEERIYIDLEFPSNATDVTGFITYPDGMNYSLYFSGSGKEWNGMYLLEKEDPSGNYTLNIIADGVKESKIILVKPFDINLEINNQTREIEIEINIIDKDGNLINDVNSSLEIKRPSGLEDKYFFENNGSIHFIYNATESGYYMIYVTTMDKYGRNSSITEYFNYFFEINITFEPENVSEIVHESKNLTEVVLVRNNENRSVINTNITKYGDIADWIVLFNETLGEIEGSSYKMLNFELNIPTVDVGNYTGGIKLSFDGVEFVIPVSVRMKYLGNLSVTPMSWSGWIPVGQSEIIEFSLGNSGRGEVIIESVEITGEISEITSIEGKPDIVEPGENKTLRIEIFGDVNISDLVKEMSGNIRIITDEGLYQPLISLNVTFIENLIQKVDSLMRELSELDKNITVLEKFTDVSYLKNESKLIKDNLNEVKNLYKQGDYERSVLIFRSVKSDVENLKEDVFLTQKKIEERKHRANMMIIIIFIGVGLGMIIWFLFKKIQRIKEYSWLYKKWRTKH